MQPSRLYKLLRFILLLRYASSQNLEFCMYTELFLTKSSGNVTASLPGHVPRSWRDSLLPHVAIADICQI